MANHTVDPNEVDKFNTMANHWWDPAGDCKPLHRINPVRMGFIEQYIDLTGKRVLDVGCGGGILTESLADAGATVVGIDASPDVIQVAKLHALAANKSITYHHSSIEAFVEANQAPFDVITCMELLEHVPEPSQFVQYFSQLLKPNGHCFLSTINRTPMAYAGAVIAAEYILRLLPKRTHDYARFIRPSELGQWLRECGFINQHISGMHYNPFTHKARLSNNVSINYLMHAQLQSS